MTAAVDLSVAGARRRRLEETAGAHAELLQGRAERLRRRAGRARLGSNERRKLMLRADGFETAAERAVHRARVA